MKCQICELELVQNKNALRYQIDNLQFSCVNNHYWIFLTTHKAPIMGNSKSRTIEISRSVSRIFLFGDIEITLYNTRSLPTQCFVHKNKVLVKTIDNFPISFKTNILDYIQNILILD